MVFLTKSVFIVIYRTFLKVDLFAHVNDLGTTCRFGRKLLTKTRTQEKQELRTAITAELLERNSTWNYVFSAIVSTIFNLFYLIFVSKTMFCCDETSLKKTDLVILVLYRLFVGIPFGTRDTTLKNLLSVIHCNYFETIMRIRGFFEKRYWRFYQSDFPEDSYSNCTCSELCKVAKSVMKYSLRTYYMDYFSRKTEATLKRLNFTNFE
jgi:hypothetical protein